MNREEGPAKMVERNDRSGFTKPVTLAIDIGGSHLKAGLLTASGDMLSDPVTRPPPSSSGVM